MDLRGKVAIITGSTSGIGQAIAELFAEQGIKVIISGRDAERGLAVVQSIRLKGGEALFIQVDLSDEQAPKKLVLKTTEAWGRLDILVNNAALILNKPLEEVAAVDWDQLFAVNLRSTFFIVQAALPWLTESKGCVLNIGSVNSWENCRHNFVYDCLKAALNHLTRGLSLELRDRGIRVNALLPGGTETPNLHKWMEQYIGDETQAQERLKKEVQKGFVADPRKIAEGALMLVNGQSDWINGSIIAIDGGLHIGQ